jgi:hypothetical protein
MVFDRSLTPQSDIGAGYGFTCAAGLITFGRLGDLVGGRTMFF